MASVNTKLRKIHGSTHPYYPDTETDRCFPFCLFPFYLNIIQAVMLESSAIYFGPPAVQFSPWEPELVSNTRAVLLNTKHWIILVPIIPNKNHCLSAETWSIVLTTGATRKTLHATPGLDEMNDSFVKLRSCKAVIASAEFWVMSTSSFNPKVKTWQGKIFLVPISNWSWWEHYVHQSPITVGCMMERLNIWMTTWQALNKHLTVDLYSVHKVP